MRPNHPLVLPTDQPFLPPSQPENICLNSQNEVKIIDFGLAINASKERPVTRLGTLEYMAPEVILCPQKDLPHEYKDNVELTYTGAIDVWAAGVLAYELMTGKAPFQRQEGSDLNLEAHTCSQILTADPTFPPHLSASAVSFIKFAMAKDPAQRPSVDEMLAHPFLEPYQEILRPEPLPASTSYAQQIVSRHESFSSQSRSRRVYSHSQISSPPMSLTDLMAIHGTAASSSVRPEPYKGFSSMSCDYPGSYAQTSNSMDRSCSEELNDGRG